VFDRNAARTEKVDVPGEFAAWAPSGEIVVVDDAGALARLDHAKTTPVAVGPYMHGHVTLDAANGRVLSSGWNATTHLNEVLALDLATWNETAISPPAPYATYGWPKASRSGKRVAWLAYDRALRGESLVVSGKTLVPHTRELVGFAWIDDDTIVAHYANRIDVLDARDGKPKGSQPTDADDMMR